MARPMPAPPPVTMATLPFRCASDMVSIFGGRSSERPSVGWRWYEWRAHRRPLVWALGEIPGAAGRRHCPAGRRAAVHPGGAPPVDGPDAGQPCDRSARLVVPRLDGRGRARVWGDQGFRRGRGVRELGRRPPGRRPGDDLGADRVLPAQVDGRRSRPGIPAADAQRRRPATLPRSPLHHLARGRARPAPRWRDLVQPGHAGGARDRALAGSPAPCGGRYAAAVQTLTPGSILGNSVRRREDPRLVTGKGHYVDDEPPAGTLHAAFVRSSLAHAEIKSLDVSAAAAAPGVVAVFTAADLDLPARVGFEMVPAAMARPRLAEGTVRFVGEPLAVVVAESREAAADAAQLAAAELAPLEVLVDPRAALHNSPVHLFP